MLVVEHRPQTIEIADHVVELGPGAGSAGGKIIAQGSPADLVNTYKDTGSETGRHLASSVAFPRP